MFSVCLALRSHRMDWRDPVVFDNLMEFPDKIDCFEPQIVTEHLLEAYHHAVLRDVLPWSSDADLLRYDMADFRRSSSFVARALAEGYVSNDNPTPPVVSNSTYGQLDINSRRDGSTQLNSNAYSSSIQAVNPVPAVPPDNTSGQSPILTSSPFSSLPTRTDLRSPMLIGADEIFFESFGSPDLEPLED